MTADFWDDTTAGGSRTKEINYPTDRARLIALAGPEAGRLYELEGEVVIGRHLEAAVRVDTPEVSRHHARISQDASGMWVIEDQKSRNGTLVNGAPITEPHLLCFGDRLQFGSSALFIFSHYDNLEEQVLQSQRMEAVGRLAGGIAHDFNNLMTAIIGTVDFLHRQMQTNSLPEEKLLECLEDMRGASARAVELTRGLLGFSGRDAGRPFPTDVSQLANEVVQLARRTFPDNIRVETKVDEGLLVMGHRSQLHQVLMNLCINARDAMPNGGRVSIRTKKVEFSSLSAMSVPFLSPGTHVVLTVTDTGIGMDHETSRRAFEPFFTTKKPDKGTGLGLATVYGVVKNHGGHVHIESEVGRGTTVRVYLPAMSHSGDNELADDKDDDLDQGRRADTARISSGEPVTVLVLDDEQSVRRSLCRLLQGLGYQVLSAADGRDGIALFAQHQHAIRVVLLDILMPNLGGDETFHILRKLSPTLPILLISGYAPQGTAQTLIDAGAKGFLQKPFDAATLQRAISRVLGENTTGMQSAVEDTHEELLKPT